MALIENLVVALGLQTANFDSKINKSKQELTGFAKSTSNLNAILVGFSTKALRAVAALVGVYQAASKIRQAMLQLDVIGKTADKLGIATESLISFRLAARQMAGLTTEQFDSALQKMILRIAEASRGSGEAVGALRELGLNAKKLSTMTPEQQLKTLADAISKIGSQSDRMRIAFKFFEEGGIAVINMLKDGSKGLEAYQKEAERLGLTMSRADIAKIEKANDAWHTLGQVIHGTYNRIAVELAPALTIVANLLVELVVKTIGWETVFGKVSTSIIWMIGAIGDSLSAVIALMDQLTLMTNAVAIALANLATGGMVPYFDEMMSETNRLMNEAAERLERATRGAFREGLMQELENLRRDLEQNGLDINTDLSPQQRMFPGAYERGTRAAEEAAARAGQNNVALEIAKNSEELLANIYRRAIDIDRRLETIETGFGVDAGIA